MAKDSPLEYEPGVLRVFQTKEETKSFYNKIAKFYDLMSEHTEQPMRDIGMELLAAQAGETILEIGFGTGHCLVEFARAVGPSGSVLGVDLSEAMVEQATALLKKEGLDNHVDLRCGDAAQLPFEPDSIDGIFTCFTLELFDTPELATVLAEWRRVLRPGGRLAVVSISKEGKQGAVIKAYEWTHKHFPNLMDCRPIFVSGAMEAAGYSIAAKKIEHMWVPVEIVLGKKPS